MRKSIIDLVLWALIGATLGYYGLTVLTFGFWIIVILIVLIGVNREIK